MSTDVTRREWPNISANWDIRIHGCSCTGLLHRSTVPSLGGGWPHRFEKAQLQYYILILDCYCKKIAVIYWKLGYGYVRLNSKVYLYEQIVLWRVNLVSKVAPSRLVSVSRRVDVFRKIHAAIAPEHCRLNRRRGYLGGVAPVMLSIFFSMISVGADDRRGFIRSNMSSPLPLLTRLGLAGRLRLLSLCLLFVDREDELSCHRSAVGALGRFIGSLLVLFCFWNWSCGREVSVGTGVVMKAGMVMVFVVAVINVWSGCLFCENDWWSWKLDDKR